MDFANSAHDDYDEDKSFPGGMNDISSDARKYPARETKGDSKMKKHGLIVVSSVLFVLLLLGAVPSAFGVADQLASSRHGYLGLPITTRSKLGATDIGPETWKWLCTNANRTGGLFVCGSSHDFFPLPFGVPNDPEKIIWIDAFSYFQVDLPWFDRVGSYLVASNGSFAFVMALQSNNSPPWDVGAGFNFHTCGSYFSLIRVDGSLKPEKDEKHDRDGYSMIAPCQKRYPCIGGTPRGWASCETCP